MDGFGYLGMGIMVIAVGLGILAAYVHSTEITVNCGTEKIKVQNRGTFYIMRRMTVSVLSVLAIGGLGAGGI